MLSECAKMLSGQEGIFVIKSKGGKSNKMSLKVATKTILSLSLNIQIKRPFIYD